MGVGGGVVLVLRERMNSMHGCLPKTADTTCLIWTVLQNMKRNLLRALDMIERARHELTVDIPGKTGI